MYNVFLRWRAVNLHWDVQSYDKTSDLEDLSTGRPLLGPRTLWLPLDTLSHPGPLDSTRLEPQSWTRLCGAPCCVTVEPQPQLSQDGASGEVVIRVTSV